MITANRFRPETLEAEIDAAKEHKIVMTSTTPNIFVRPYKSPNIPKQNCPSTNPISPDAFIQLLLICDGNENVSVAIRLVSKQPGSKKIIKI